MTAETDSLDYRSALDLVLDISHGLLPIPIKIKCGHTWYTITDENFHAFMLGVMFSSEHRDLIKSNSVE